MTKERNNADVAFIQALAEMLNANELTELSVKREYGENDSLNVRVSKQTNIVAAAPLTHTAPPQGAAQQTGAHSSAPSPGPAAQDDPAQHPGAVTSPMVGTVYLQSEPGTPPFVSVGASVEEGQTLLIIEAMKTMNQIAAPQAGTVKRILVSDGTPVEYGAPMMIIE